MAAERVDEKLQGVLVADPRFGTTSKLATNTAAALTSDYTQSNPRPGTALAEVASAQLRPAIEGGQGADVDVRVMAAGNPGRDGVQLGYKLSSDAAGLWRGWQTPNEIQASGLIESAGQKASVLDMATIPSTQEVIAVYAESGTGGARSALWSPSTWTWTANGEITDDTTDHCAVAVLPGNERIVAIRNSEVLYSDDKGQSWSTYSARPFRSISGPAGVSRMVVTPTGALMLVCRVSGSDVRHYASNNSGATWSLVGTYSTFGNQTDIAALPDGRILVVYRDTSTSFIKARIVPGPYSTVTDYTEISVHGVAVNEVAVAAEPDGTVYVLGWLSGATDVVALLRSTDSGNTWKVFDSHVFNDGGNNSITNFGCVAAMGALLWSSGDATDVGRATLLGGWTNLTSTSSDDTNDRRGWADGSNRTWFPFDTKPGSLDWTEQSSGTNTSTDGVTAWDVTTTTGTRYAERSTGTSLSTRQRQDFLVNSGGSLSACAAGMRGVVSDNSTKEYIWALRCTDTTVRLYDEHGSANVSADVSVDMTARVQWHVETWNDSDGDQQIRSYYRSLGSSTWTPGHTGTLTNTGGSPAANGTMEWPCPESGTADVEVYGRWENVDSATEQRWVTGRDNVLGRPLGSVGIPAPDIGTSTQVGRLSARGGVGQAGDGYTIEATYDYPIANALVGVDPSPAVVWRSDGLAEQIIAFDLDYDTLVGRALGVFLAGCNFRTAYLESSTGGAWTTRGTIDLATGFASLKYTRSGDTIRPDSSTTSDAGRPIWPGGPVGGHVILDPAGTPYARPIDHARGGAWSGSTSVDYPELRLRNITGSEPSSGTCHIVWPAGLHVLLPTSAVRARYWRLRIPAQDCPNVDYQIGALAIGPIRVWGQQDAWGWSKRGDPNATSNTDRYGTTRKRKRGPIRRSWVRTWDETDRANILQSDQQEIDYISATVSSEPLVSDRVVWEQLRGALIETESGAYPVVCCDSIPADDTTLTDPSRLLYGHMGGYAIQHVVGRDDALDGVVRPGRLTVDEVV